MRKAFFLFAVFILAVGGVVAQENPQRTEELIFSIEPTFGMRIGKEGEIVWAKSSKGDQYKLSELEWEYTPAFYLGANLGVVYKRLEISFLSKFFIPSNCGTIKDSDWLQDFYYKTGKTSIKTNYSESENNIQKGHDLELAFAIKMYPTHFLTLRPRISVNYSHMEFSAIGGKYWYGKALEGYENNRPYPYYYPYDSDKINTGSLVNAKVIHYKTSNIYLWTGIQADFIPSKKIEISLTTEVAALLYTISFDNHILKNIDYKQYSLSIFYGARQKINTTFNLNKFFSLCINFSGVFTGETIGPSYHKSTSQKDYILDGDAGAYSIYFDAGICAKFKI